MTDFSLHTIDSAPDGAKETLGQVEAHYGFVPNLLGMMSESPGLLKGYVTLSKLFAETTLSPLQQQVVLLTVSRFNGCDYCMAAHSMSAKRVGLPQDIIESLRQGVAVSNDNLESLRAFTTAILESRGFPAEDDVERFIEAGYSRANVLDVVLGIGLKLLSNYTNHIVHTPLDSAFNQ